MIRNVIESYGFSEGMTYSFESPKAFDKLLIPEGDELRKAIEISNPLGVDYSIMRTTPLNGMLTSLSTNYNHRNKDAQPWFKTFIFLRVPFETIKKLPFPNNEENDSFSKSICKPI